MTKDRRVGFEMIKNKFIHELYFKYPIQDSITLSDGSLVY